MNHRLAHHLFLALSLTLVMNNANAMEGMPDWMREQEEITEETRALSSFFQRVCGALMGTIPLWQVQATPLPELPQELKDEIIGLVIAGTTGETLKESATAINALAQVNKSLNTHINNIEYTAKLVNHLAKRFGTSYENVCNALQTKTAKKYLEANLSLIRKTLSDHISNVLKVMPYALSENGNVALPYDVNFTFNNIGYYTLEPNEYNNTYNYAFYQEIIHGGGNILMLSYIRHYELPLDFLWEHCPNIDINLPNNHGTTPLMIAVLYDLDDRFTKHLLEHYPHVNINQQDHAGDTALLLALQTTKKIYGKPARKFFAWETSFEIPRRLDIGVIKRLLQHGADPELPNNAGLTPLQAAENTGDDAIIQLIKDAIEAQYTK